MAVVQAHCTARALRRLHSQPQLGYVFIQPVKRSAATAVARHYNRPRLFSFYKVRGRLPLTQAKMWCCSGIGAVRQSWQHSCPENTHFREFANATQQRQAAAVAFSHLSNHRERAPPTLTAPEGAEHSSRARLSLTDLAFGKLISSSI